MKYALLGYDTDGSLDRLPPEEKRILHGAHRSLHDDVQTAGSHSVTVIAHYRFRPPGHTTTVRLTGDEIVTSEGPSAGLSGALRAIYLLESDDPDAVLDLVARLPAVRMGGTVEIWPLIEPTRHA
jgi:hypothetical protein